MSGAYAELRAKWSFAKDQNLPKSYLVEFHPKSTGHTHHDWASETVFKSLKRISKHYGAVIKETDDPTLFYLAQQEKDHSTEFIIDCLDPRFLSFHTLSNAASTDRFVIDGLTQHQSEFDLFWFPVTFLEDVARRENVVGWEARFDSLTGYSNDETLPENNGLTANGRLRRKSHSAMRCERVDALKVWEKLKDAPDIMPDVPLNSVTAERYDETGIDKAQAKIYYNGKITGKGTDYFAYLQIVNGLSENYANAVRALEKKYWICLTPYEKRGHGFKIEGEPFCIKFDFKIDVSNLISEMFSCAHPFRLMGEADKISHDYYAVDAMDLHINQPVSFEIAPELMRIYLYEGTCGNTLVRIVRALQHYVDSKLYHPAMLNHAA